MGCCGSKEHTVKPDEEENSLIESDDRNPIRGDRYGSTIIDHQAEQESLKRIVERTAANLIDISSNHADRLQQQDAQDRANEYRDLLSQIQIPVAKIRSVASSTDIAGTVNFIPNGLSSSIAPQDVLGRDDVLGEDDVSQLFQAMDEVQDALSKIEIRNVGDIVVPLTFSSSAPIHALH